MDNIFSYNNVFIYFLLIITKYLYLVVDNITILLFSVADKKKLKITVHGNFRRTLTDFDG